MIARMQGDSVGARKLRESLLSRGSSSFYHPMAPGALLFTLQKHFHSDRVKYNVHLQLILDAGYAFCG